MQETQIWSSIQEDPTRFTTTKSVCRNYWAHDLELRSHDYWAQAQELLKPVCPRARATQQEKPL